MDLGATVCTRSAPRCDACPVARDCVARREDRIAELPSPRPAKALPQRAVRVLVHRARRRDPAREASRGRHLGRAVEPARSRRRRRRRAHCQARFARDVAVGDELAPIEHGFTHFQLTMHPQRVAVRTWPPRAEAPGLAVAHARRCARRRAAGADPEAACARSRARRLSRAGFQSRRSGGSSFS